MSDAAPVDDIGAAPLLAFPTVAIGASAGGVDALRRFFTALPPDTGCAYVVVMHLDPDRDSMLAPLLGRATAMPVQQAKDGMAVEPNKVYVVPPGKYLAMQRGTLTLTPIKQRPPRPKAVDHFMATLAHDQRDHAIGIVLSGTDGDGALGVKAIKSEGGMTLAQMPDTAEHAGMPSSAVATGMIDQQLEIEQMPSVLTAYVDHAQLRQPGGTNVQSQRDEDAASAALLFDALARVRAVEGLDFRGYKKPMLLRRLRRRMGLAGIGSIADYVNHLKSTPAEVHALARDFLISVTEFFREPQAWVDLAEEAIPDLLEDMHEGESVRVWVPACATGEEAYSLAMVLLEHPLVATLGLKIQVFATDVDREALDFARNGHYPATVEETVSAARLRRFFQPTKEGEYVVRKELRDVVLFALHNVISDPPFSRISLISCRNLLIYMEPELQRRVLQTFHFALDARGFLFLGKSETVGPLGPFFTVASQRSRIYRRTGAGRLTPPQLREGPPSRPDAEAGTSHSGRHRIDYAEIVRDALLARHAVAAVLANREGHALYLYGTLEPYLHHPEGAPTSDLFAMLDNDLRPHVRAVMHKSGSEGRPAETSVGLRRPDGNDEQVHVTAAPLRSAGEDLVLLTFEHREAAGGAPVTLEGESAALRALDEELRSSKRELRAAVEELEAANEELKVSNEEAMSVNEELQSSNEELETSKEELQSVNEELTTVNHELQQKVIELERSNNDIANLLSSTHIPTLFLDRGMRIKRFTPAATRLFSLIPTDAGRPLGDIAARCDMGSLLRDASSVLQTLAPQQAETTTPDGETFLRRTMPYRTQEDRIEGVVITFIDITQIKRAVESVQRFASVMQGSTDAIIVHELEGRILAWNRGAEAMYGYTEAEAMGTTMQSLLPEEVREAYAAQVRRAVAGEPMQGIEAQRRTRGGKIIDVSVTLSPVATDGGAPKAVALIERDITGALRAQAALRESEQRFRALADSAPVLIWVTDGEGRITFANNECATALGRSAAALQGLRWTELLHPDDEARALSALSASARSRNDGRFEFTARVVRPNGTLLWTKTLAMRRADAHAREGGLVGCMVDIHAQVDAEESLRNADQRKDEFLAMLGHELRNPLAPIRNAAEVLARVGGDDKRIVWVRDTLLRQVGHVTRLVDDLLDISRITRGALTLRHEPVDLGFAIAGAIDAVRPLLEQKRHRLESHSPVQTLWVEGDAIRLTQIFENLLTNAVKYTDEGGRIGIDMTREGDEAVVHVRDNGMGIAPGMQSRVFELFVQDEGSVDRSQGGLGIGLALVRHLVELHGGRVQAVSEGSGHGSDFIVRLPLLSDSEPSRQAPRSAAVNEKSPRVLVIDDDADSATSLAMILELDGIEVQTASQLDDALRVARAFRPQVAVLDLAMPAADGYEVMRRLRALPELAGTKYVALSGFGRQEDYERTRREGFAHHFVKPVDPTELEVVLRALFVPD